MGSHKRAEHLSQINQMQRAGHYWECGNAVGDLSLGIAGGLGALGAGARVAGMAGRAFNARYQLRNPLLFDYRKISAAPGANGANAFAAFDVQSPFVRRNGGLLADLQPVIPTYRELKGMAPGRGVSLGGAKAGAGFQAHHILPQYLGKMLGYTRKQMLDHPATLVTHWTHLASENVNNLHKAINKYLPSSKRGQKQVYSAEMIQKGLKKAYNDIDRLDLFNVIKPYLDTYPNMTINPPRHN